MRKFEAREFCVLALVSLAHVLIVTLLLMSLVRSGVIPKSLSIATFNVLSALPSSGAVAEPSLPPVAAEADAPTIEITPSGGSAGARGPSAYDPFAGAVAETSKMPPSLAGETARLTAGFEPGEVAWLDQLEGQIASEAPPTQRLEHVMIEVLAQPDGGFEDIRMLGSTGVPDLDRRLLDAVFKRQSLVGCEMVTTAKWVALPKLEFGFSIALAKQRTAVNVSNVGLNR